MIKKDKRLGFSAIAVGKRLVWIAIFLFFLFCVLVLQFYRIQVIEEEKWTRVAKAQHQLLIIEPFKRGLFYSNTSIKPGHPDDPQPFVIDVSKFHLFVDALAIPPEAKEPIAAKLISLLGLKGKEAEKLKGELFKKSRSRKLAMWLDRDKKEEIEKCFSPFFRLKKIPKNALYFVQDYKRSYPFGKMLGQVLHTVREDRDKDTHQSIPTGGLELVFNKILKGKQGKKLLLRSPRHPLDTDKILSLPEHGADVYLTINHYLQAIAEEEIVKAVKNASAKGGWAIMMDPYTGEILALAQYPFFDPSDYRKFYNDPVLKEETKVKALTDPYEPGSTFKPITIAIALKANEELKKRGKAPIFSPTEKIATSAAHFPGRSTVVKDTHNHPYLNMYMGLQKSSNVYMAKMVQRIIGALGEKWYREALHDIFSLGEKTGIELPGETAGLLPTPGKKHPNGALEWSGGTPYALAFGHNIMVNGLQMLKSYAVIANGGFEVKPTIVRKIVKSRPEGEEILLDHTGKERAAGFKRVLEKSVCDEVIKAMKLVTKPGGTASRADIYGYTEAGKTGTSEKIIQGRYSKNIHFSTFIGFAPTIDPRFVLIVAIDEPESKYIPGLGKNQHAGNCAAPAFREIGARTLQYLGAQPDDPYGFPVGDPRYNAEKADMIPTIRTLKALYEQWNTK